ncbi:small GTP-binding protein [Histomonas meleagridis]|uniref:small GTP-binding protein n=1 Tax=Histomonas meleagridis TaxID=135588 RepID=UPI00355A376E|nr:small GTP-binding protein [Histomonas meleagridis]KAH0801197.1 small GTP-binding protein [Histomonas meleagridis]
MASEATAKVVLVGDSAVGKTAITLRYVKGAYSPAESTIGADILTKSLNVHGQKVNLAIWDTAGQEEYRTLTPMYYRDASIVIIVFAVGDPNPEKPISRSSFSSVSKWYEEVTSINENAIIVLCGNMNDLDDRKVSFDEGNDKAEELTDVEYFETSALSGDGIDALFENLAEKYLKTRQPQDPIDDPVKRVDLKEDNNQDKKKKCC